MASLVKKIISTAKAPAALGPYRYASARGRSLGRSRSEREQALPVGFREGVWRGVCQAAPRAGARVAPRPRAGTDLLPPGDPGDTWGPAVGVGLQCWRQTSA